MRTEFREIKQKLSSWSGHEDRIHRAKAKSCPHGVVMRTEFIEKKQKTVLMR
jgi:hypothetical protein